ncbi:phage terminase small subunit-related protein (plasmid) [Lysinibacillus capsici]|nr:phage terminase small subunit-related protein [Lysinibacillus capsici]UYB50282.1 phage terminase small subunit-related protein [Lysinibacillus capsici]
MWLKSGREKKLKEIATELEVSDSLVRKWKSQDKWDDIPDTGPRRGHRTEITMQLAIRVAERHLLIKMLLHMVISASGFLMMMN